MRNIHVEPLLALNFLIKKKWGRQYLAARALGLREDELSSYLTGRRSIPEKVIIKLERALGCDREQFSQQKL